jgi:hypothetical protein
MPVKKKGNRKNIYNSEDNSALIPKKATSNSKKSFKIEKTSRELKGPITSLATARKKKRPK